MDGEEDKFEMRPAPPHLCEAQIALWNERERKRVKRIKGRLTKNLNKSANPQPTRSQRRPYTQPCPQHKPGVSAASTSTRDPVVMGLVAIQPTVTNGDYPQADVAKYEQLKKLFTSYVRAVDEWVASFHGANVQRIRVGRDVGLEAGNLLRAEIDAFACHAALETDKRIRMEELGRALLDRDVPALGEGLGPRTLPAAEGAATLTQSRPSPRDKEPPPPSPAPWNYDKYSEREAGGNGSHSSDLRHTIKRVSVHNRIYPPVERPSRGPDLRLHEHGCSTAEHRSRSSGSSSRLPRDPTPIPLGLDPTQRQRTRPLLPVGLKSKPSLPLPASPGVSGGKDVSPSPTSKEKPDGSNATEPHSPVRASNRLDNLEELLLRSPPVSSEGNEAAMDSPPPTPDVAGVGGPEKDAGELDGITIHEKDLIAYSLSATAERASSVSPYVPPTLRVRTNSPKVDSRPRRNREDGDRGRHRTREKGKDRRGSRSRTQASSDGRHGKKKK